MLTTKQVAAQLGITPRMVVKLIHQGRINATRISHVYIIDATEVDSVRVRRGPGRPGRRT